VDFNDVLPHYICIANLNLVLVDPTPSILLSKNININIYRNVILPVVLYGCETWSLTLREEHRMKVLENRVLRKIFRPKRDEVRWKWRRLRNEMLRYLYFLPNSIRMIRSRGMRWAGHVTRMGGSRGACRALLGRPERRRPLGRVTCRWEDNIKIDLQ
jgi:hypothetical protein